MSRHDPSPPSDLPIAILGAGPTGLEAALAAAERGLPFVLYEASSAVAGHVRAWGHVRLFTPWDLDVSPRMRAALERAGTPAPAGGDCPTGAELAERLFEPLAALPAIAPHLRLGERVVAIGREGLLKHEEISTAARAARPFRLLVRDAGGAERIDHAGLVIDSTGTFGQPNTLGDGGIPAPGEEALESEIVRDVPDVAGAAAAWVGKTTLLVGGGHTAQTVARDLSDLAARAPGTRVIWALRGEIAPAVANDDPLPERARLNRQAAELSTGSNPAVEVRAGVVVDSLAKSNGKIEVVLRSKAGRETITVDRIVSATGFVPDDRLYRQLQVHECYAFAAPMKLSAALLGSAGGDCLAQTSHGADTLLNPEPNFYILGAKSYGRNNSFLMRVGWEQVTEVFARIG